MDQAEADVLAHLHFPPAHRVKLHSTSTLERLNKEVKRRTNVVGVFPNVASIHRLIGAVLMEQNEDWQLQHRYLPQHIMLVTSGGSAEKDRLTAATCHSCSSARDYAPRFLPTFGRPYPVALHLAY